MINEQGKIYKALILWEIPITSLVIVLIFFQQNIESHQVRSIISAILCIIFLTFGLAFFKQRKEITAQEWGKLVGNILLVLICSQSIIESHQVRSIIGVVLGIITLACGLFVFKSIGLKFLVAILAPECVMAYFDGFVIGTKNRWIKYHYSYRGKQYTGKGRALEFNELSSPNTPFTLFASRINPKFSYRGDPRVGLIPPLLFLLITIVLSIYFIFGSPEITFRAPNISRDTVNFERYSSITQTR